MDNAITNAIDAIKENPAPWLIGAGVVGVIAFVASRGGNADNTTAGGLNFSGGTAQSGGTTGVPSTIDSNANALDTLSKQLDLEFNQASRLQQLAQSGDQFKRDQTISLMTATEDNRQRAALFDTSNGQQQNLFDISNTLQSAKNALEIQGGANALALDLQKKTIDLGLYQSDATFNQQLSQAGKTYDFLYTPLSDLDRGGGRSPVRNSIVGNNDTDLMTAIKKAGQDAYNAVMSVPVGGSSVGGGNVMNASLRQAKANSAKAKAEQAVRDSYASFNNATPNATVGQTRFDVMYDAQQRPVREQQAYDLKYLQVQTDAQKQLIQAAQPKKKCTPILGFGCGTEGFIDTFAGAANGAVSYLTGGTVNLGGTSSNGGGTSFDWSKIFGGLGKKTPTTAGNNSPLPNGTVIFGTPPIAPSSVAGMA